MGDQAEYMEQLTVGMIVEGKVKSLTKFGAFITLPDGSTGMVHISAVAHTYVNDIHDHLHEGDTVKVMIIGMENGKTNLSIKRTIAPPPRKEYPRASARTVLHLPPAATPSLQTARYSGVQPQRRRPAGRADEIVRRYAQAVHVRIGQQMSSIRAYSDRKTKTRRR